jgi:hypothetical protein
VSLPPAVYLAARHLDPGEGPCTVGHVLTDADVAALCQVRSYLGSLHRSTRLVDAGQVAAQEVIADPAPQPDGDPAQEALALLGTAYVQAGRVLAREFVRLLRG